MCVWGGVGHTWVRVVWGKEEVVAHLSHMSLGTLLLDPSRLELPEGHMDTNTSL